jgi:HSP20 family protein
MSRSQIERSRQKKQKTMSLISRRGVELPRLRSNISDLLNIDDFFNRPLLESPFQFSYSKTPAINIYELDDEYTLEMAAPGMKKKDFYVDIDNGLLEIKVEKEDSKEEESRNYTRKEYDYTSFYRSFNLPDTVKDEKVKAEYKDGILKIHLPKVEASIKAPVKEIAIS